MPESTNAINDLTPLAVSLIAESSPDRLERCLKSLASALPGFSAEIFVTDNSSSPDVESKVLKFFPGTQMFKNSKVLNAGACHNRVLKEAKADFILMFEDTVEFFPQTLHQLKTCLERHPDGLAAGPVFYSDFSKSGESQPRAGINWMEEALPAAWKTPLYYLSQTLGARQFFELSQTAQAPTETVLSHLNGSCLLARREALLKIGGFEESYLEILQEHDLGRRSRRRGYKLYRAEGAKCLRDEKKSLTSEFYKKLFEDLKRFNKVHGNIFVSLPSGLLQTYLKYVLKMKGEWKVTPDLSGQEFNKILIYKTGSLKDFLLITPAIQALRKRYPEAHLVLLGNGPDIRILDSDPSIDEIRELPENFLTLPLALAGACLRQKFRSFFRELSLERWDLFIELENLFSWLDCLKPWLVGHASRAPWRLGLDTNGKGFFLTHKVKDTRKQLKHATRKYADVVGLLGASTQDFALRYTLEREAEEWSRQWLEAQEIQPEDFLIMIHATGDASSLERTSWPRAYFVQTLNQLGERHRVKFVFISGSDARQVNWTNALREQISPLPLLTEPDMTMPQRAALLKQARFLIASDSDILHLAAAVKTPAVGIFGPGDYQLYGSYGEEADLTAIYRTIDCRPCVNFACSNPVCLKTITPEAVLEIVSKKIAALHYDTSHLH